MSGDIVRGGTAGKIISTKNYCNNADRKEGTAQLTP